MGAYKFQHDKNAMIIESSPRLPASFELAARTDMLLVVVE